MDIRRCKQGGRCKLHSLSQTPDRFETGGRWTLGEPSKVAAVRLTRSQTPDRFETGGRGTLGEPSTVAAISCENLQTHRIELQAFLRNENLRARISSHSLVHDGQCVYGEDHALCNATSSPQQDFSDRLANTIAPLTTTLKKGAKCNCRKVSKFIMHARNL